MWEYYQDAAINARPYTAHPPQPPTVPKNIFNEYGFNIGGPVYIPKILTGKKKLFFFEDFERTTRRQLITGTQTVPDPQCWAATSPQSPPTILSTIRSPGAPDPTCRRLAPYLHV